MGRDTAHGLSRKAHHYVALEVILRRRAQADHDVRFEFTPSRTIPIDGSDISQKGANGYQSR